MIHELAGQHLSRVMKPGCWMTMRKLVGILWTCLIADFAALRCHAVAPHAHQGTDLINTALSSTSMLLQGNRSVVVPQARRGPGVTWLQGR